MQGTWDLSGQIAFACEISPKRDRCSVMAAGRHESGKIIVDLSPYYGDVAGAPAAVAELNVKHDPVAVVVDPRSHAGTLIRPLRDRGVWVTEPSTQDVVVAHGEFLDLLSQGAVWHLNQPPFNAAAKAAQQRSLGGAEAWERKVDIDQSPLVAATLACWGFRRWEELSQPGAWML